MACAPSHWRSPEELLEVAIDRSRLVLVNEAHNGLLRPIRSREIGLRMVIAAHNLGVRHLAMEPLPSLTAEIANQTRQLPEAPGYLGQPEMRQLIRSALDRGWDLIAYEADMSRKPSGFESLSVEETNWRGRRAGKEPRTSRRQVANGNQPDGLVRQPPSSQGLD